ncbi:MAG TPA: glycine zipper 2TM domain-containing protein [Burkholderiaceae bacterium]|nr:glycine zipper 2TM domain-containing protein [Burkholderiaceae bacterium]
MRAVLYSLIVGGSLVVAGCQTWEGMSREDRATAIGAGVGGVAGHAATGGGTLGTVGGAAAGGLIGREVERRR